MKDGGPAFPVYRESERWLRSDEPGISSEALDCRGMSLRDYFAARAPEPPQWWACSYDLDDWERVFVRVSWAWAYADAMLEEREKPRASDNEEAQAK